MQTSFKAFYPPALPRHASRDHLHDRNRGLSASDPANPGLQTYVRVTRRRFTGNVQAETAVRAPLTHPKSHKSLCCKPFTLSCKTTFLIMYVCLRTARRAPMQILRERQERLRSQWQLEKQESAAANELLELRSQNIRKLLASRSRGWTQESAADFAMQKNVRAPRIAELEQQLKTIRAQYAYAGVRPATVPPSSASTAPSRAQKQAAQQVLRAHGSNVLLRGGWPVDESFRGPLSSLEA
jgi:hypothetical protein